MNETLITVENVSKKFCRDLKRSLWYGIKDLSNELLGRKHKHNKQLRKDEFWAVNDASFELKRGECLGLIGRNGAGKTTLLRILNGLIKPDKGRIEIRGRVGALIALGSGFNPILSGRENIYVNSAVLGLGKKEIDEKFEEIVDFAEISEFIDAPVQSYSSGMKVRLGFAVATTLNPDVLILDEVLAVGDAAFRHKCYHRVNKLLSRSAVIFVSHSMDAIAQITTSTAMMKRGDFEFFANPIEGIASYTQENATPVNDRPHDDRVEVVYPPVRRADVRVHNPIQYGGCLSVDVEIECATDIPNVEFAFTAVNLCEQPVMCWHTNRHPKPLKLYAGTQRLCFRVNPLLLHNGDYYWDLNVLRTGSIEHIVWFMHAGKFTVSSGFRPIGNIPYIPDASNFDLVMLPTESAV